MRLVPSLRIAAVAAAVVLGASVGWAQEVSQYFRLEWEVAKGRRGQSIVGGTLYNDYGFPAVRVQLLVEGLDAGGQTINQTVIYIDPEVPARGRASFQATVPARGAAYRVTVHFFDWLVAPSGQAP